MTRFFARFVLVLILFVGISLATQQKASAQFGFGGGYGAGFNQSPRAVYNFRGQVIGIRPGVYYSGYGYPMGSFGPRLMLRGPIGRQGMGLRHIPHRHRR